MDRRCQQFTSTQIANEMLDLLGYRDNLYGKTLLENSCGEGNILCLAVERYIKDAFQQGYSTEEISLGLERDICGAEVVEETYEKCIDNLNILAKRYNIASVRWNIFYGDVLVCPFKMKFNYIIGNPPYISYRNLDKSAREYIKLNYRTCAKGKPDYCYAFIENAINYLDKDGHMVYLVPNSIYKNVYANDLRNMILNYIEEIRDYPNKKLFKNAMTSSSIMLLKKSNYNPNVKYKNIPYNKTTIIKKDELTNKWIFNKKPNCENKVSFDNFFDASMTIATQRNNVFVVDEETRKQYEIEDEVLRPAVSPRNQKYKNEEKIIFPYEIVGHTVRKYGEEEFYNKFPHAYDYLSKNRDKLDKRAADKSAKWFEFGRSQAIHNMNKKKLMVSTVVTNEVRVYELDELSVPYAGIYVISKGRYSLELAKKILCSDEFYHYIKGIGTPASGKSLRITAKDINNYCCSVENFC